jgi:hypothetical protein
MCVVVVCPAVPATARSSASTVRWCTDRRASRSPRRRCSGEQTTTGMELTLSAEAGHGHFVTFCTARASCHSDSAVRRREIARRARMQWLDNFSFCSLSLCPLIIFRHLPSAPPLSAVLGFSLQLACHTSSRRGLIMSVVDIRPDQLMISCSGCISVCSFHEFSHAIELIEGRVRR